MRHRSSGRLAFVVFAVLAAVGLIACDSVSQQHARSPVSVPTTSSTLSFPSYRDQTVPTVKLPPGEYRSLVVPGADLVLVSPMVAWQLQGQAGGDAPFAGSLGNIRPGRAVEATTDGGRTWSTILQPPGGAWTIDPVTAMVGYVIATETISMTVNGGRTWSRVAEPAGGPLVWAEFFSSGSGFGLTADDRLVHTTNGGGTWTADAAPDAAVQACFTSPSAGYVIDEQGAVYASTDQGGSWREAEAAPPRVNQFGAYDPTISCGGPSVTVGVPFLCLAACGGTSHFSISRSDDAGRTWTGETDVGLAPETELLAVAADARFSVAAIAPSENSLQERTDGFGLYAAPAGAASFQRSTTPPYAASTTGGGPIVGSEIAVTGETGWAVEGTTLWKTDNDGSTWTPSPST